MRLAVPRAPAVLVGGEGMDPTRIPLPPLPEAIYTQLFVWQSDEQKCPLPGRDRIKNQSLSGHGTILRGHVFWKVQILLA